MPGWASYGQLSDIPIVARTGASPIRQISHKQVKAGAKHSIQQSKIKHRAGKQHLAESVRDTLLILRVKSAGLLLTTAPMHRHQALPTLILGQQQGRDRGGGTAALGWTENQILRGVLKYSNVPQVGTS